MRIRTSVLSTPVFLLMAMTAGSNSSSAADKPQKSKRGRPERVDHAPKVGAVAPLFTLKAQDGKSRTALADFKGKKPVVLFFGSYT